MQLYIRLMTLMFVLSFTLIGCAENKQALPVTVVNTPSPSPTIAPPISSATITPIPTNTPQPTKEVVKSVSTTTPIPVAPKPTPTTELKQKVKIEIISVTSPAARNSHATLKAKVAPGATASITVHYKSGASKAAGLEDKEAGKDGLVSWTWKVGGNTTIGTWPITVSSDGMNAKTEFEVIH